VGRIDVLGAMIRLLEGDIPDAADRPDLGLPVEM
jgi:hypothetical protein